MKKFLRKILFIIVIEAIIILLSSMTVNASIIVKTEKEAKENYEKYEVAKKTEGLAAYRYDPVIFTGKKKTLSESNNIEIKYFEESQKELFDYRLEGDKLIVSVKDEDIYNMIKNYDDKTDGSKIRKGTPLYNKFKKYVSNTDSIGLYIKIYYKPETEKLPLYYTNNRDWYLDESSEWIWDGDFELVGGTDEKGTYLRMEFPTTLIKYWEESEEFEYFPVEGKSWNNQEIMIFDKRVLFNDGRDENVEITLNSGEKRNVRKFTSDYIRFEPILELKEQKKGDVNNDGKINTKDAREVLLAYIGKTKLTEKQKSIADINNDGKVNTKDARQILLYYIGKIKQF